MPEHQVPSWRAYSRARTIFKMNTSTLSEPEEKLKPKEILVYLVIDQVLWSLAIMLLWNWFVFPIFPKYITFLQAMGLNCLHSLLWARTSDIKTEYRRDYREILTISSIGVPIDMVVIGGTIRVITILLQGY